MEQSEQDRNARREAEVFGRYLVGQKPGEAYIARYVQNVQRQAGKLEDADKKLLTAAARHPRLVGYLDAGLALRRPTAELRRRIYLMFAILEASPEWAGAFLCRQRGPLYAFYICFVGMRAAWRAGVGLIVLKVVS